MTMQELFVKICGITNVEDALWAAECGANAVGFNFYRRSKRYVTPEAAGLIGAQLPEYVSRVGVFVDPGLSYVDEVLRQVNLSALQLHGDESSEEISLYPISVIKAFRVSPDFLPSVLQNYSVDAFLLDTFQYGDYGGTGRIFDWNIAVQAKQYGKIILSGGLTPANIEDAIRFVRPYGVDVSSGVEKEPGKKDHEKIKEFIARARSIYAELFQ